MGLTLGSPDGMAAGTIPGIMIAIIGAIPIIAMVMPTGVAAVWSGATTMQVPSTWIVAI